MAKLEIKEEIKEKIKNLEFKKEHLGAIEFSFSVTNSNFEKEDVEFRIERVTPQTFLKLTDKTGNLQITEEALRSFISLPLEAKKLDFFKFDNEALGEIVDIATTFQQQPLLYAARAREIKGDTPAAI
ncbi:hypothetical protein SAMN02745174_02466 [Cetobacterium ceti]|uniref:Uncharacterized protein n=1 Tax=Cetobacterium ceti TaxID=180163 RepID=A0A1T4QVG8_9FUSO|nr:hypothetical protein [Cetobacterium ceti]SKA07769.1 hypothetical protein SAMN02745174_02466 [Cetobacterium ceti]